MRHKTIREQDEFYCTRCHKRWDVKESPPVCESVRRVKYLKFINENGFRSGSKH
jgi:hypothetical protein